MIEHYRIESGIPVPQERRGRHPGRHRDRYPWGRMNVGDSFQTWEPGVRGAMVYQNRTSGKRFVCRMLSDYSYRVWRVA